MLLLNASLPLDLFLLHLFLRGCLYGGLLELLLNHSAHHSVRQRGRIVWHVGGSLAELVYRCLALDISGAISRSTRILRLPLV